MMEYFEPNFLDEALVVLEKFGPAARVLAGGTILGSSLRAKRDAAAIVNVKRIPQLSTIERTGDVLRIGALATAQSLAADPLIAEHAPLLGAAAASIGAPQLRSVATIGGNVLSGHHAADLSVALLALDAIAFTSSLRDGPLSFSIEQLLSPGASGLGSGALLTVVEVPIVKGRAAFQKMQTRRAFEMALVSAAATISFAPDATVTEARLALGGAASMPIRATAAEAVLAGRRLDPESIADASNVASDVDAEPRDDVRASTDYRRHLCRVLVGRALRSIESGRPERAA
jgi:carbon-monoxide dehydrogenase medium subunit